MIGEKVAHRLAQHPGSYTVLAYTKVIIKRKADQHILPATSASSVFDRSIVDVSFLAGMLVDKFVYHCPLHRQHQKLLHSGIQISRSSLDNWTTRSIDLLEPIVQAMLRSTLQSKTLAMDETPIKAGYKEKGKLKKAWFWPLYGDKDEVVFTWSASRSEEHITRLLTGYEGTLLTDGYAAYKSYVAKSEAVVHAQCWAHTRRYFERALSAEPVAANALALIRQLYQHEQVIRDKQLTGETKRQYRTEQSLPVIDAFFA